MPPNPTQELGRQEGSPPRSTSRGHRLRRRRSPRGRSDGGGPRDNGQGELGEDQPGRRRDMVDASLHRRDEKSKSPSTVASPGSEWPVDRGRSRVRRPSNPFSEDNLRRRGYHSLLSSFGKTFVVEKRWKLVREMGSGAYGVVISAADEISGETVAIKMVTRVFEKVQLAKRALREITLLRHFANHENITGLIDVDVVTKDFNEIYIFMEPMEADLHQIIKSGQTLTNEHTQYFLYQILRGMKFIHSAGVIHRDLTPGNLLVNADCELKICDFGLSRGYDDVGPAGEEATRLTEYVATRWYRAPEIMLAFPRYNTAIDVWSIGCILGELLLGKPLFKGKDYVDQLNKILDVLGSPDESITQRIGSDKAQAYVRSLPFRKPIPFRRIFPGADPQALDLMAQMLTFDPTSRLTVPQSLAHPWLSAYHDELDEPVCSEVFERWREIEKLETMNEFKEALWNEVEDYRREVRGIKLEAIPQLEALMEKEEAKRQEAREKGEAAAKALVEKAKAKEQNSESGEKKQQQKDVNKLPVVSVDAPVQPENGRMAESPEQYRSPPAHEVPPLPQQPSKPMQLSQQYRSPRVQDPVVSYARRSSIMQPSRQGSTTFSAHGSPVPAYLPTFLEGQVQNSIGGESSILGPGTIAFPTQQPTYVVPARSRTGSTVGGAVGMMSAGVGGPGGDGITRKLLRTLSTVSIHETGQGREGGLAGIAPIGKFIVGGGGRETEDHDAPPSEMPDLILGSQKEEDEEEEVGRWNVDVKERGRKPLFHVE